ncbi:MAG TPA: hypothetical protein VJN63_07195, partial [Thermoplasmata archaeon]|nr:hypothetical protein [Thermoplasmata archaeon]
GVTSNYETDLEGTAGWDIAKVITGTWSEVNPNAGTATANTWTRIAIAIYGTGMRVFKDGTQINPASSSFNVGTELSSGNIGFRKWAVGSGFAWWIDDAVARKYVDPEPTNSLAAEQVNEVQYTVCRDLATSNCDATSEFTRWDGTVGYDVVGTGVETSSYPSLATTYEANGDLWVAYVKNADSTTRAIYARFLDYPSAGWAPEETADSLSGTLFTKPSIGVDSDNNVHALYVATIGPQLYYKSRTAGSWGARTAIDTSSDNPTLMVRAPNSPPYGSGQAGGLFWKTTTSETYFHYIPEFETLVLPVTLSVLVMWMWRRAGARRHDRAQTSRRPTPNDNQGP